MKTHVFTHKGRQWYIEWIADHGYVCVEDVYRDPINGTPNQDDDLPDSVLATEVAKIAQANGLKTGAMT